MDATCKLPGSPRVRQAALQAMLLLSIYLSAGSSSRLSSACKFSFHVFLLTWAVMLAGCARRIDAACCIDVACCNCMCSRQQWEETTRKIYMAAWNFGVLHVHFGVIKTQQLYAEKTPFVVLWWQEQDRELRVGACSFSALLSPRRLQERLVLNFPKFL